MMKKLNKVDRPLLLEVPKQKRLSAQEVKDAMAKGVKLIDARVKTEFAAGHIPGSINIQGNNSFATWAGWLLNYEEPFMILAPEAQMEDLTRKLMRIGLDNVLGYLPSVEEYTSSGGTLATVNVIDIDTVKSLMNEEGVQIVDLRGATEYKSGHIPGAAHVFIGTLPSNLDKVDRNKKVVVLCQGGDRATIGYSILAKEGYTNLMNYSASMNDWIGRGNAVAH
jgi:hydroxyacylglutathione hydrolase